MGQSALQPSRLLRGVMYRIKMETTVAGETFGTAAPSLLALNTHVGYSHRHHMEQVIHGFHTKPQTWSDHYLGVWGGGGLGLKHFPESRRIWCMLVEHPARFGSEMIRGWEDRERKRAGAGGRGGRKEARTLIALPGTGIIYCTRFILYNVLQGSLVYWEVYLSTRLSLTPAGMWKYVWSRLNFIYAEIGTLEPPCRLAELFWRVKMSLAG